MVIEMRAYHVATYPAGHSGYLRDLRPDHWEVRHDSKRYVYERPSYHGRPLSRLRLSPLCDTAQDLIAACEQMGEDSAPIFEEIAQRGAPYKGKQIGPGLAAMKEAMGRAKSALGGGAR